MQRYYSTFFLLLLAFGLRAATPDSSSAFSVSQAIEYALTHQKDVLNAQLDASIAKQQVNETIGIGLPQINGKFDVQDFVKIPTSVIPGEFFGEPAGTYIPVQFGTQWQANAGISASQLLFEPSYIIGVQASRTISELSQKNVKRSRIETAVAVYKAYYNHLLMLERKKVIDANVERVRTLRDNTKALYDNGFVEKTDADRIEVTYNNLTSEQEKFNRLLVVTEQVLKFQMGMHIQQPVTLTDRLDIEEVKKQGAVNDNVDPAKRIEYGILQTQMRLQEYNVKRYQSGYLPSLVAYGSLSAAALRTEFTIFNPDYRWYPTGIIGATLNVPIFDGLQKRAKIRQEKYSLQKIQNEIKTFDQAVRLESNSNRAALLDAQNALSVQEKNLQLANDVVRSTRLKYEQGVGSNLEVIDAETTLKEAQANYYNAIYDAIVAKINLDKALGNLQY